MYAAASDRPRPSGNPALPELTEDLPLVEHDELAVYSRTKLQSERALIEVASASGLGYTIFRPTCVYGPHTKPFTLAPVRAITRGRPAVIGDGNGPMDVVYVDDVAGSMIDAAESPEARDEIFNIGHETVPANEFYAHFGRMLNCPVRHLPVGVLKGVSRALQPFSDRPVVADIDAASGSSCTAPRTRAASQRRKPGPLSATRLERHYRPACCGPPSG